jgi:hypothetical protein
MAGNKRDIDFIGYTYKGDVEQERSMLVNVLKELDSIVVNTSASSSVAQEYVSNGI